MLSCLQNRQRQGGDQKGKEVEVLVIGYIGQVFGEQLKVGQEDSVLYTAFQFIQVLLGYLGGNRTGLVESVAKALQLLYTYVLGGLPVQEKQLVLVDPLLCLLNTGTQLFLQLAAHHVLSIVYTFLLQARDYQVLSLSAHKYPSIFIKTNIQSTHMFISMGVLFQACDF